MINTALTSQDVYKAALALTFTSEANAQDFRVFFHEFLNLCLQEALETENSIRLAHGEEALTSAPRLADFGEAVPYHENIIRAALPYGVASYFFQDDMDDWRYAEHRARFVSALSELGKASFSQVEVSYGKDG